MRRVNLKTLSIALASVLVLAVSLHFLHAFQLKRNAGSFLELAEREEADGNNAKAIDYLERYLVYKPDNKDAKAKRALLRAQQAESSFNPQMIRDTFFLCDEVLRESPDRHDVRRKAAILKLRYGLFNEALEEVEKILLAFPDDPELFDLQGQCQFHAAGNWLRLTGDGAAPGERAWNIRGLIKEISRTDLNYQKDFEKAYLAANKAFQKATQKDPARIAAYERRAYLNQYVHERFLDFEKGSDKEIKTKRPSSSAKARQDADKAISDMVANNPGAFDAYLTRIDYRKTFASPKDQADKSWNRQNLADLKKAQELAPEKEPVLLASAEQAFEAGDNDSARKRLEKGVELYPKNMRFYEALARLELEVKSPDKAVNWMRLYLDAEPNNPLMRWRVARLLIDTGHSDQAEADLEALEKTSSPGLSSYLRGRIAFRNRDWLLASNLLEAVRSKLDVLAGAPAFASVPAEADMMLAECYDRLEEKDRLLDTSKRLAQLNGQSPLALVQLAKAQEKNGLLAEALSTYRLLSVREPSFEIDMERLQFRLNLRSEIKRFNKERSRGTFWQDLEARLDRAEETGQRQAELVNERVNLKVAQSYFFPPSEKDKAVQLREEARQLVERSRDLFPIDLDYWLALANVVERQGQADAALALLNEARKQTGDSVALRLAFGNHWLLQELNSKDNKAFAERSLAELERDLDSFSSLEQIGLLAGLADIRERAGQNDEAKRLWTEISKRDVAVGRSQVLVTRLRLFDFALLEKDEDRVKELLGEIKNLESEEGPIWRYAQATQLITFSKSDKNEIQDTLDQARNLLVEAASRRSNWPRLKLLQAYISDRQASLLFENKDPDKVRKTPEFQRANDKAIQEYQRAIELGERKPEIVQRTIQLLALSIPDRTADAEQLLTDFQSRDGVLSPKLAKLAAEVALKNGDKSNARDLAVQSVRTDTKDAHDFLWLAGILNAAGAPSTDVEKALLLARKANEDEPDLWLWTNNLNQVQMSFIPFYSTQGIEEAEAVLKQAEAKLIPLNAHLPLAKCYMAMGHLDQAEKQLKAHLEAKPADVERTLILASFYQSYNQIDKAKPYLRQLLESDKGGVSANQLIAARRMLALALMAERAYPAYPNYLEALRLVETNEKLQGNSSQETKDFGDKIIKARVLASRPEKRVEALKVLDELAAKQPLSPDDEFLQAQLYDDSQWPKAQMNLRHLMGVVAPPANGRFLVYFIQGLIKHRELAEAPQWLNQLEKLFPNAVETLSLRAQLIKEQSGVAQAEAFLTQKAKEKDAPLLTIADLLERVGRPEAAEPVFRTAVEQSKNPQAPLVLAGFLGRQNRTKEALDLCVKARETCPAELVAATSVGLLRVAKDAEVRAAGAASVQAWIEKVLEKDPKPALLTSLADLLDLAGKFVEAEKMWRKTLAKDPGNVMALNNLACLLAYRQDPGMEAQELIEQAIDLFGPDPEMLDTQGMVYLARKEAKVAIEKLQLSLQLKPSPTKQFHLAQAHLMNNDDKAARLAWQEAIKNGLKKDRLHPLEKEAFDKLEARMAGNP
ncbi:MAG: tetratricopeptide repeat protein [Gemmataceae bacterium]